MRQARSFSACFLWSPKSFRPLVMNTMSYLIRIAAICLSKKFHFQVDGLARSRCVFISSRTNAPRSILSPGCVSVPRSVVVSSLRGQASAFLPAPCTGAGVAGVASHIKSGVMMAYCVAAVSIYIESLG